MTVVDDVLVQDTALRDPSPGSELAERPSRRRSSAPGTAPEIIGCLVAAIALVAVAFALAGTHPYFGMFVCVLLAFLVLYGVVTYLLHGLLVTKDRLATVCIWIGASLALFPLAQILWSVTVNGASVVFSHFPDFLVHDMSTMGPKDPVWKGGMGHAIIGTFEQVGLATLYTVPISVLTATYLSETSSTFSRLVRTVVDCMMGTPSIIAGLFVYLFWVEPKGTNGFSGFAASIALAILMLPVMIRTAEEVIRVVPGALREAALALGSPRWKVSLRIVIPTVRSGLLTAIILGVALAVGETAPTLFTAHGSRQYNVNPFHGVQANLPLQSFQLIFLASDNYVRVAWGGAFILVFLVLTLFILARVIGSSRSGQRRIALRRRRPKEVTVP
jgi:phosphate transport system permease protein